jgi:hypothetical protein
MTFERILRTIFRLVTEDNQWTTRMNVELKELYKDINIWAFIELQCLRWMGHLLGMDDARNTNI